MEIASSDGSSTVIKLQCVDSKCRRSRKKFNTIWKVNYKASFVRQSNKHTELRDWSNKHMELRDWSIKQSEPLDWSPQLGKMFHCATGL